MRLAGTAGRSFKEGDLVIKSKGDSDLSHVGILLHSYQNGLGVLLGRVLTSKSMVNWYLSHVDRIENESNP